MGTGTSQGVPMIACHCRVCTSTDPRNRRMRSCLHIVIDGLHVQVDAGPEFRLQCLREGVEKMDFFILTHGHSDHVTGMDDLRRFCDLLGGTALTVFTTDEGMRRVRAIYPYAMGERPAAAGYAAFKLELMPATLELPQGIIRSTPLPHGSISTLGLVFEERSSGRKLVYYNDCKSVPPGAIELATGADIVVLDGLRVEEHPTHMNIAEACQVAAAIGAPASYLTHLTHRIDYEEWTGKLPGGVQLAYDGLRLRL
ncbi:MAG TPA: MBL fold metallo-hydrolase [Lacunisphaera sp.]|nr:MBL fold metallo-hydrolase [Lacunisphaera sp.]